MALVALLKFIPRTGSLASHWRLAASWFSPKLLARACCRAFLHLLGGDGMARRRLHRVTL